MDSDLSASEMAKAVAVYLEEELDNNPGQFIPVHRDIALVAVGLAQAVADKIEQQEAGR